MVDYYTALGFFWLIAGIIVFSGALLVYSLKKQKPKKKK
jgi:uncharacterized membrane protein YgdD (TMEM256/DUF423 family)